MLMEIVAKTKVFMGSRKGQGMTEYAVVVALVVAIAIAVLSSNGTLATAINGVFTNISTKIGGV